MYVILARQNELPEDDILIVETRRSTLFVIIVFDTICNHWSNYKYYTAFSAKDWYCLGLTPWIRHCVTRCLTALTECWILSDTSQRCYHYFL